MKIMQSFLVYQLEWVTCCIQVSLLLVFYVVRVLAVAGHIPAVSAERSLDGRSEYVWGSLAVSI